MPEEITAENAEEVRGQLDEIQQKLAEIDGYDLDNETQQKLIKLTDKVEAILNPDNTQDSPTLLEESTTVENPVAKVTKADGTEAPYTTLQEAIDNAGNGDTVTLVTDTTENIIVPEGKNITLDLGGKTINTNGTTLINNGILTIKDSDNNGTIKSENHVAVAVGNNSNTTIESGNFESVEGAVITSKSVGATITIKGGTFSASDNAVIAGNGTERNGEANTITINDGTFNGSITSNGYIACGIYAPWKDNITVTGGTFNITDGIGVVARAGQVKITNGTFNVTNDNNKKGWVGDKKTELTAGQNLYFNTDDVYPEYNEYTDRIQVSGGKFSNNSTDIQPYLVEGYMVNADGSVVTKTEADDNYVAQIDSTKYNSLAEAIRAVTNGTETTITLLQDTKENVTIPSGQNIILDLNGHTLNGGTEAGKAALTNQGTVTIMDSSTDKTGTIKREDNNTAGYYTVRNDSIMYIKSGTITNNSKSSNLLINYNNQGNKNFGGISGVYMKISGGTIKQTSMSALKNDPGCEMHITGDATVIERNSGNQGDWACNFYGKVVIDGGTITTSGIIPFMSHKNADGKEFSGDFTITGNAKLNCHGVYLINGMSGGQTAVAPKLTISGGTISSNQVYQIVNDSGLKVTSKDSVANIDISGGTFNGKADVTSYLIPTMTLDNTGKVVPCTAENSVAEINRTYYNSLQAAITAANNNDTVKLVNDTTVTGKGVQINQKTITLDLNGNTITGISILNDKGYGAVNINNGSTVTVIGNNGGITAEGIPLYVYGGGKLTVNGGTYKGNTAGCLYAEKGDITVLDGYFSCEQWPDENGKFFVLNKKDSNKADCHFIVYGGTFVGCNPEKNNNENPEENQVADGYTVVESTDASGTLYKVIPVSDTYVAKVENDSYPTIEAAINAIENTGTITLLKNTTESITIPAGKDIILDLGSNTLTNKEGDHTITNKGTLTITGIGTVDNVSHQKAALYNNGTATLNGGTFTRSMENGISAIDNGGNSFYNIVNHGTMEINGASVTQTGGYSSMIENGYQNGNGKTNEPSLTITSGTFDGGLNTVKNDERGKLTISDGTFSNTAQHVIMNWNVANITGGIFTGNSGAAVWNGKYGETGKGELTISGGDFTGKDKAVINSEKYTGGTIAINGGTFNTAIPYEYCANGYIPVNTGEEGKYTVSNSVELTLDKKTASITVDGTVDLKATVTPAISDPETVKIIWTSDNETVATVDTNGKIKGIAAGEATITASIAGKTATCTVTVTPKTISVESLTLNKSELSLLEGDSETLTANVTPADADDKTITWSSSDKSIATVDENGTVTGVSAGAATITAAINDNIKATCTVTVTVPNYTVTYTDGVNDAEIFADQTSTVNAGEDTPAFSGTPTRDGYTFAGWSPEIAKTVTANAIYTAQWTPIGSHTVTYTDGVDDAVIFEDQIHIVRNDQDNPTFEGEVPARANYNFTGWSEPATDANGNITITAQWSIKPITITYTDGVATSEIFADQVYNANPSEATPAFSGTPTRDGYTFTGWSPAVASTVTANVTYTAQWEEIVLPPDPATYTVTYTDGVDDAVIFEDQTSTVSAGTATPAFSGVTTRDGYTFAGWSPEIADAVTADAIYTAQWTPIGSHTVTYTDGVDDAVIFENQVYTVRNDTENIPSFEGEVPARANYNFTGWSEPATDANGNITITAQWSIKLITITYTDGVTTSEIFADQVYNANPGEDTPAFSGTPTRDGYTFAGWSPAVADTVTVDDGVTSITYTAQWSSVSSSGSSGGGGGGGSSTPSVTPNNPPTTNIGENDTPLAESPNGDLTLTVDGTAADNIAKAEVKPEDINDIVTKATDSTKNVTVNVKTDNSGNGAVIDIPAASIAALGEKTGADLIVNTDAGSITISNSALSGIGSDTGNITITVTKANDSDIDVTVAKDGVPINTIAGGIKAVIPVTSAAPGTVAILVNEDGSESIFKKEVASNGSMTLSLDGSAKLKVTDNSKSFADTPNHWAKDAVDFVTSRDLFQGVSENTFSPNGTMSRAMLVTVLHRLENTPAGGTSTFPDVAAGTWYTDAVAWAADNGIVTGTGAGFNPNGNITREQLAAILYRYAQTIGINTDQKGDLSSFSDNADVSDWAQDAMSWAVGAGLINGKTNGKLDPAGNTTRAEVAAILMRMCGYMAK